MLPDGFQLGPIYIYFYGILITLGVIAAAYMSARLAPRFGQDPERVWDMLIWVLIGGIVGARLWHVFTPPPSMVEQGLTTAYYLTHPLDLINTRKGGLGIPGAVIGGGLAMFWYTRRHKLSFATWADIVAPGLALAQAIGRWGNYFNQEVYGAPTNLPWAIFIDSQHRLPDFLDQERYHPLFLYECIWNLITMGVLLWLGKRYQDRLKPGDIFLAYLLMYPIGRFLLEFLRLDSAQIAGINANQTLMAVVAVAAGVILFLRHRAAPVGAPGTSQS
jgi:phosphatidylglycerol:prolipoprotein diacylglycerol transferase